MNTVRHASGFSSRIPSLSERHALMERLQQQDFMGVSDLAGCFDVAEQTIWWDLNSLCERGMARRVRGGIQRLNMSGNMAYSWRQVLQHDEKQAIAREVARHVPNGVSVAFSIGTTPEIICGALLEHDQLRIFTNNLNLAMLVCTNPGFEVTIAGGRLHNEDRDILGRGHGGTVPGL